MRLPPKKLCGKKLTSQLSIWPNNRLFHLLIGVKQISAGRSETKCVIAYIWLYLLVFLLTIIQQLALAADIPCYLRICF